MFGDSNETGKFGLLNHRSQGACGGAFFLLTFIFLNLIMLVGTVIIQIRLQICTSTVLYTLTWAMKTPKCILLPICYTMILWVRQSIYYTFETQVIIIGEYKNNRFEMEITAQNSRMIRKLFNNWQPVVSINNTTHHHSFLLIWMNSNDPHFLRLTCRIAFQYMSPFNHALSPSYIGTSLSSCYHRQTDVTLRNLNF